MTHSFSFNTFASLNMNSDSFLEDSEYFQSNPKDKSRNYKEESYSEGTKRNKSKDNKKDYSKERNRKRYEEN